MCICFGNAKIKEYSDWLGDNVMMPVLDGVLQSRPGSVDLATTSSGYAAVSSEAVCAERVVLSSPNYYWCHDEF